MSDQQMVTITLKRRDAAVALLGLEQARRVWIADMRRVGGKTYPTPYDDAIAPIAAHLRQEGDDDEG